MYGWRCELVYIRAIHANKTRHASMTYNEQLLFVSSFWLFIKFSQLFRYAKYNWTYKWITS